MDVWNSEAEWERFQADELEPAVGRVLAGYGLPHDHSLVSFEQIDVIDTWLGAV